MKKINLILFAFALAFLQCNKKTPAELTIDPLGPFQNDPNVKGCDDFFITKILDDNKLLHIGIIAQETTFKTEFQVFEKIQNAPFADIFIEQNDELDKIWFAACNDYGEPLQQPSVFWTLSEGKLTYKVDKIFSEYGCVGNDYRATVILENAIFKNNDTGETLSLTKEEMTNVRVGWCAG